MHITQLSYARDKGLGLDNITLTYYIYKINFLISENPLLKEENYYLLFTFSYFFQLYVRT